MPNALLALEDEGFLISPDWLYTHLNHPQVVIVDCRFSLMQPELGRQQYETAHIPGASYLDLNQDLSGPLAVHGGRHPLPEVEPLTETLNALGIHSEPPHGPTLVVAYDDSRLAFAARLWWLLRYLGHDRVAVLDGGFSGWQAMGYPTDRDIPSPQSGRFVPIPQPQKLVDIEAVKQRKAPPQVVLVDSREAERYRGEQEPIDPIAGHIPGALNYPWHAITDAQSRVHPIQQQQQRWVSIKDAEEIIVYCGSGVTACVNLLSLELAGIQTGKLYAGSWSDWCSYL